MKVKGYTVSSWLEYFLLLGLINHSAFAASYYHQEVSYDFAAKDSSTDFLDSLPDDEKWMAYILPANYKIATRPGIKSNQPVIVEVQMDVWSIPTVDIESMTFEADILMYVEWIDNRLNLTNAPFKDKNSALHLEPEIFEKLWTPQLIFRNCRKCNIINISEKEHKFYVAEKNSVFCTFRISEKFFCGFKLQEYPMDVQECMIQLESAYDDVEDVILKPLTGSSDIISADSLPQFDVTSIKDSFCHPTAQVTRKRSEVTTNTSCVELVIVLERLIQHHLMLTFIPSALVVMLSWVSFWLDVEAVPARVAVGVTGLLTLTTQFANSQRSLPQVSYIKAIDVWMLTCMFAVFASIIQFAFVNFLHRSRKKFLMVAPVASNKIDAKPIHAIKISTVEPARRYKIVRPPPKTLKDYWNDLFLLNYDKVARVAFPVAFALFNLVYWPSYL